MRYLSCVKLAQATHVNPFYMKQFSLLILSMLGVFGFAQSPTGTIRGKVLSPEDQILPFASVILYSQVDSGIVKTGFTNDKGEFILTPLPAGTYFYTVAFTELKTYSSPALKLAAGQTLQQADLRMAPLASDMEAVQIVARKPLIEVLPDKTVFNVSGNTNAIGDNGLDLLRKSPGVIVDNNNNIILMGKSGVRIYIDNKPSPLTAADLAEMLKGMNANQIEAIEIITNPSAKFDAEGNAGIINIRLKKDKSLGTNGSLTGGVGIPIASNETGDFNPKYNGSINLNHRNKRANFFGNYSSSFGENENFNRFLRRQSELELDQFNIRQTDYLNHNVKAGADFFLVKKHTLGIMVNGFSNTSNAVNDATTDQTFYLTTDEPFEILDASGTVDEERMNLNTNLNYQFDNKQGVTWNVDADYGIFRFDNDFFVPNYSLVPNGDGFDTLADLTEIFSTSSPTEIDIATFKLDHARPFLQGQLETGVKLAYVVTQNTFNYFDILNGEDIFNTERSNDFTYTENINAAYASYQRQLNQKWNFSLGLRVEQTNTIGELKDFQEDPAVKADTTFRRNYLNFFPSAGFTYSLNQQNMIRLNYSRRIDRPRYQNLNPFEYRLDKQTFQKGNPNLLPQYTHNVQLTYTYKYRYNATASYSYTSGFFTEITDTLGERSTFLTRENLSTRIVYSLNLGAPIQVKKWWNMYVNTTFSYTRQEADFNEPGETGKTVDIARPTFNIFSQQTFNLPKGWAFEASGFYNSPSIWGANFLTNDFWGVNAGIQKRLLDNSMVVKVSMSDVFLGMRWGGVQEFGGLYFNGNGGWESRQVKLDLSYNFGNNKVKSARRRKTGLEDESNRVNGGGGLGN